MKVKITSIQSFNPDGSRPYYIQDLNHIPSQERTQLLNSYKLNHKVGLLKMEVINDN